MVLPDEIQSQQVVGNLIHDHNGHDIWSIRNPLCLKWTYVKLVIHFLTNSIIQLESSPFEMDLFYSSN